MLVNRLQFGNVATADGVDHEIKFALLEHVELVHGCFHRANVQASFCGDFTVEFQLIGADVHHRDPGTGGSIEWRLTTSASSKAQKILAVDVAAEPAVSIQNTQRIAEFFIFRGSGKTLLMFGQLVPRFTIVTGRAGVGSALVHSRLSGSCCVRQCTEPRPTMSASLGC